MNEFSWIALDDFGPIRGFKYRHQAEDFAAATGCIIKKTGTPEPVKLSTYDSGLVDCGPCLL